MACARETHAESEENTSRMDDSQSNSSKPTCIIVLGMAGSGKTTFVQRLTAHLHAKKTPPYVINLDPAVHEVPYPANIGNHNNFIINQTLLCMLLYNNEASSFPTVVVYVMDTSRSVNPITFMSNMLYACSILYKAKLPFIVAMNKIDIIDNSFAVEWMTDFEAFQDAVGAGDIIRVKFDSIHESRYRTYFFDLIVTFDCLFSQNVGVSSMTGEGVEQFFKHVNDAVDEYEREYKPQYEKLKKEKERKEMERQEEQIARAKQDMDSGKTISELAGLYVIVP
ncbi:hypothetical protein FSP39_021622 [Pinctada imbricata]|uniref:GPN-loop GTPase n=1 Tax=Pinctada imbricata TaxID=66713 RepID=A0AA88Y5R6_PINIB|nr:hypothetical protein FSP39_021622 [Pinctada imbricata]